MSHSNQHTPTNPAGFELEEGSHREIVAVWLGLMLLLGATVLFHTLAHGTLALIAAFGIAALKVGLVMGYYMHLKYRPHLVWIFAGAAFLWLIILFALSLSDYFTRHWIVFLP